MIRIGRSVRLNCFILIGLLISLQSFCFAETPGIRFCTDVDSLTYQAIGEKNVFSNEEKIVTAAAKLEGIRGGKRVRFIWLDPQGSFYGESAVDIPSLPKGMHIPEYLLWNSIIIRTNKASCLPGKWKVQLLQENEKLAEGEFTIEKKGPLKSETPPPFKTVGQVFTETVILGRVIDAKSGKPIDKAIVSTGFLKAESSRDGLYLLNGVVPGHHNMRVEAPGYNPCILERDVKRNATLYLDVMLDNGQKGAEAPSVRVFPESTIYAGVYHLYDIMGKALEDVLISNNTDIPQKVFLTARIDGYSSEFNKTLTISPGTSFLVRVTPTLLPGKKRSIREAATASINTSVSLMKGEAAIPVLRQSDKITILAHDTLVYIEKNLYTGKPEFLFYTLPAWVTPHMKGMDELIRRASELHPQKKIVGYQTKDINVSLDELAAVPREQAKAIYRLLQEDLRLTYANPSTEFGTDESTTMAQRSRLPDDIVKDRSANCLESTVIFSTLLEAAHLDPVIVVLSAGHAFVGWEKWSNTGEYEYLKTTDIGKGLTFEEALEHGNQDYRDAGELFKSGKAIFLNIPLLRSQGIIPME